MMILCKNVFFFNSFFIEKKSIESFICNNAKMIMQLIMLLCVTLVIAFTWTFGYYFDMMIL